MPQQYESRDNQYFLKTESNKDMFRVDVVDFQGRYVTNFLAVGTSSIFLGELSPDVSKKLGIWEHPRLMLGDKELMLAPVAVTVEPLTVITQLTEAA